ncbi:unnamed protein product [Amoebophrya sp. A25]|nr:unnamed protein product [Amoebophrya sp. A25]|eukprot:GSA25T00002082001.1
MASQIFMRDCARSDIMPRAIWGQPRRAPMALTAEYRDRPFFIQAAPSTVSKTGAFVSRALSTVAEQTQRRDTDSSRKTYREVDAGGNTAGVPDPCGPTLLEGRAGGAGAWKGDEYLMISRHTKHDPECDVDKISKRAKSRRQRLRLATQKSIDSNEIDNVFAFPKRDQCGYSVRNLSGDIYASESAGAHNIFLSVGWFLLLHQVVAPGSIPSGFFEDGGGDNAAAVLDPATDDLVAPDIPAALLAASIAQLFRSHETVLLAAGWLVVRSLWWGIWNWRAWALVFALNYVWGAWSGGLTNIVGSFRRRAVEVQLRSMLLTIGVIAVWEHDRYSGRCPTAASPSKFELLTFQLASAAILHCAEPVTSCLFWRECGVWTCAQHLLLISLYASSGS